MNSSSEEDEYTTEAGGFGGASRAQSSVASAEANVGGRKQVKRMRWELSSRPRTRDAADDDTDRDGDAAMDGAERNTRKGGHRGLGFMGAGTGVSMHGGGLISSGTATPFLPIKFVSAGKYLPSSLDESKKQSTSEQQTQQANPADEKVQSNSAAAAAPAAAAASATTDGDDPAARRKAKAASSATEFRRLVTGTTVEREMPPPASDVTAPQLDHTGSGGVDADERNPITLSTKAAKKKKAKAAALAAWELSGTGIARKMMDKLGFDGTLGSKQNTNAISRPIEVQTRPSQLGLGFGGFKEATHLNKELDKKDNEKKARKAKRKAKKAAARRRDAAKGVDEHMGDLEGHWQVNSDVSSSDSDDADDMSVNSAVESDADNNSKRRSKVKDSRRTRREKRIYKTAAELAAQHDPASASSSRPGMVIIDHRAKTPRVLTNLQELAGDYASASSGSDSDSSSSDSSSDSDSRTGSGDDRGHRRSRNGKGMEPKRLIGRELVYNMGSLVQLAELELSGLGVKSAANAAEESNFTREIAESTKSLAHERQGVQQLESVIALVEEARRLVATRCAGGKGLDQRTAEELETLFRSIRRMSGEEDYRRFRLGRLAGALVGPALKDWAEHRWNPLDATESAAGAEMILCCKRLLASQSDDQTATGKQQQQRLLGSTMLSTPPSLWGGSGADAFSGMELDNEEDMYEGGQQRYSTDASGRVVFAREHVIAKVLRVSVLPRVLRALVSEWDIHKPDQALQLASALRPVVGTAALLDLLRSSVLPRLVRGISSWEPPPPNVVASTKEGEEEEDQHGSHHIHTWLQPWLSVLRPELEASYSTVRARLEEWMQLRKWTPVGRSGLMARNALLAWRGTWTAATIQRTCVRCVVPKLLKLVRAFEVNPADQRDMEVIDSLMAWRSVIAAPHVVCIIVGELLPKWLDTMCVWLQSADAAGNAGVVKDVAAWYVGWKQRFPVDLQQEKSIVKCFGAGLRMLAKAKAGTGTITLDDAATGSPHGYEALLAEHKRQHDLSPTAESGSNANEAQPESLEYLLSQLDDVSIRESVEHFAEEHGLSFMPHPKRTQDGVRVYQLGTVNVLLQNNTIKVEERVPRSAGAVGSATQWTLVTSMDDLKARALGPSR